MANAEVSTNRLIKEKSPYLLQHAHNPVDWYPWGEEAFQKAKTEDKPIFLSIGYSTCHWCHVMEEESYSNPEIANILNQYFVVVKVDREERPDIDSVYMNSVQAMTGSGGWPLNVFLTSEKKPFYGGTYFPPDYLKDILLKIADTWKNRRSEVTQFATQLTGMLNNLAVASGGKNAVSEKIFDAAFAPLSSQYDPAYGGFGSAPKFPTGHTLSFLLRFYYKMGNKKALEMVENTLDHLVGGGIFDHLGGGFHRYSTDQRWFLPHFEKMLYDQAILANVYLEAYQITKKEEYAEVARAIFEYVLRDMSYPEGGFYSAEDADSAPDAQYPDKKVEGAYYVWTKDEVVRVLGKEDDEIFSYRYGIKEAGNVDIDPRHEFRRKNVLSITHTTKDTAVHFKRSEGSIEEILARSRQKLFLERSRRVRPRLDDKILTDWNGLMISSLALGGKVLNEPRYVIASKKTADFIINKLKTKDGRLLHRFRDGSAEISGFLDDYAFFINGLLDLYEATFEVIYLKEAIGLARKMPELFEDKTAGGFFFSAVDSEVILSGRVKEYHDGAIPSGNSLVAMALLRLYRITLDKDFKRAYDNSLNYVSGSLRGSPAAFTQILVALYTGLTPAKEIVIVSKDAHDPFIDEAALFINRSFLPGRIILLRTVDRGDDMATIAPWAKEYDSLIEGKTTIYVCENRTCNLPVTDLKNLGRVLQKTKTSLKNTP